MSRFLFSAAVMCVALAGISDARAAEETAYTIKYTRPMKVGERFEHEVKTSVLIQKTPKGGTLTLEQAAMASKPTSEKLDARFTSEVLETTPGGFRSKVKVTFTKLADITLGKPRAVVPEGTELVLTLTSVGQVEIKASDPAFKLTPEIKAKAEKAVGLKTRADLDVMLGGVKPRKVGEAWKLDSDMVLKSMGADQSIGPRDPQGTAKLVTVESVNGTPNATIEIVTIVKGTSGVGELSTGKLMDADFSVVTRLTLPVAGEVAGGTLSRNENLKVQMEYLDSAPIKTLTLSVAQKRDEVVKAIK